MGRLKVYDFIFTDAWKFGISGRVAATVMIQPQCAFENAKHLRPLFASWCAIRPKPLNREAQTVDPKLETRSPEPQTLNSTP